MSNPLTREQFDAAELRARREIAVRQNVFDPQESRMLNYFLERSLPLGRSAAYFRSYRQLGRATETKTHAHETLKRLVKKKVLAPLPFATKQLPAESRNDTGGCWHWYGVNLNFADWPEAEKRPAEFWEEPALPVEPELDEMLRETFVELSAGSTTVAASTGTDRGPGSVSVPHADKGGPETNSPGRPVSRGDSKTELPTPQYNPEWQRDLQRLKQALTGPTEELHALTAEIERRTPTGYAAAPKPEKCTLEGVPPQGTGAYPSAECTPTGYAANPSNDAANIHSVPSQGTSPSRARALASLALSTKTSLATPSAPPEGTRTPEKTAEAWNWLQKVDSTDGLRVARFHERWALTCELYPGYVLSRLRGAFDEHMRRVAKNDPEVQRIENPLGWLSAKACEDGRMLRFKRKR
jgi:hypothetical protein